MKKLAIAMIGSMLAGSIAMAADAEDSHKATVDTSKNPITGTQTTTKKWKKKSHDKHGTGMDAEVTEKTKVKTDGTVEKKTDVQTESTQGH
jgi:hypothetical protein